jgi:peptidyl-prolyl cis-trans isomerase SurA
MKKTLPVLLLLFLFFREGNAQTLFTYGKYSADAKDFMRAYNKNNTAPVTNKAKVISDYLDLYIKSRLKIREAYERRYDTLANIRTEIENLRTQIVENYMSDPTLMDKLVKEAFERSQKDYHVAHIYIAFRNSSGATDTIAAQKKLNDIMARLKKGEDFAKVARENSDDTTARKKGGDIGYITVFTLPYEFENAIYSTAAGKYSSSVRSRIGYHIFKVIDIRKAVGKVKAQQILLAFPPGADEATKKQVAAQADSIYKRLLKGDDFNRLATDLSNDYMTAVTGGLMPDIGVGQYDAAFEKVVFSLPKDGAISKPFQTSHGWHIVKRVSLKPVVTDPKDKPNRDELEHKIANDNRSKNSKDFIYKRIMAKPGFKNFNYDDAALWNLSDSILDQKPLNAGRNIQPETALFAIGDTIYDAEEWIAYAGIHRFKSDGTGVKPWDELRDEWIKESMQDYYRDHLEDYNEEFRNQMTEFREGNLFFEIMQVEVWNKAQNDSIALLNLYNKNKDKYLWKQSADAVLFFCSDINTAKMVHEKLKANPADWKKLSEQYSEKVIADSARYEWEQIPNLKKTIPKPGMLTSPELNTADNTASFAYIVNVYAQPMPRSFAEARGLVINDYQGVLEEKWNEELKKKYPVIVNQKVLAEISK